MHVLTYVPNTAAYLELVKDRLCKASAAPWTPGDCSTRDRCSRHSEWSGAGRRGPGIPGLCFEKLPAKPFGLRSLGWFSFFFLFRSFSPAFRV